MTIKIYPSILFGNPPSHFSREVDDACEEIHEACKGFGTDEDRLMNALTTKDAKTRYLIHYRYEELYEKGLRKVVDAECGSGPFGTALQYLALPADKMEAMMIKDAMDGAGTTEAILFPILCGRDNDEIAQLKETFFNLYDMDLGVKLSEELSGDFERLIFHSVQGLEQSYDRHFHSKEKAEEDAEIFYEAGSGSFGTDERGLFEVISKSPPEYLEKIDEVYVDKHERTLINALDTELGGDVERGATHAVGMKLKPYETVAKMIAAATKGFGTNETLLTMTLIRYQNIMKKVNKAHKELYDMSIQDRITDEAGGEYEKLLIQIVDSGCD